MQETASRVIDPQLRQSSGSTTLRPDPVLLITRVVRARASRREGPCAPTAA
jgi:hypothetical protein